jgi:chemotaxis protein CheC
VRLSDLSDIQIDALREVGNIGASHAATALSQMVGKPIQLSPPTLDLIPQKEIPRALGGPEQLVGAVYSRLLGDIEGGMLFMAPRDASLALADLMHGREVGTSKSFGRDEEALITHVGSILASAHLAAVARFSDLNVLPATPAFALDMAGAILDMATAGVGLKGDTALLLRTNFSDEDTSIEVILFFLPDQDSLDTLLGRLGVV